MADPVNTGGKTDKPMAGASPQTEASSDQAWSEGMRRWANLLRKVQDPKMRNWVEEEVRRASQERATLLLLAVQGIEQADETEEGGIIAALKREALQRNILHRHIEPLKPADETAERETIAAIEKDIERLLDGFDTRLEAVNRRLDRVLERRT